MLTITTVSASTPRLFSIYTSYVLLSLSDISDNSWSSPLFFMDLEMLKVRSSLFNLNFIYNFSMSTKARPVASNSLPRIIVTSQSRITKSAGNINDSTFTFISWSIPIGLFTIRSTISNCIAVGFGSPTNFF